MCNFRHGERSRTVESCLRTTQSGSNNICQERFSAQDNAPEMMSRAREDEPDIGGDSNKKKRQGSGGDKAWRVRQCARSAPQEVAVVGVFLSRGSIRSDLWGS